MNKQKTKQGRKLAPGSSAACRLPLWICLTFAFFYLLCSSGHVYTPDGVIMYRLTKSLMDRGECDIEMIEAIPGFGGTMVNRSDQQKSKFYAKYGLGFSLAAAPAYLAGKTLAPLAPASESSIFFRPLFYNSRPDHFDEAFEAFAAGWTNSLVTAAVLTLLFLICVQLGFSTRAALLTVIVTGIASPLWHYAKTFFSEPLATLGLLGFFYFAIRGREKQSSLWSWGLAGLMLAITILTKLFLVIMLFPAGTLLLIYAWRHSWRWFLPRLAVFASGIAIAGLIICLYNYIRFNQFFETGYGPEVNSWSTSFFSGLWGLLASPGRGLLLYFPLWLLIAVSINNFRRKFPAETIYIFLCTLTLTFGYAKWYLWEGGWCWGPRFLLPLLPLLTLPVVTLFENMPATRLRRNLIVAVLLLSLIVAINGVIANYFDFYLDLKTAHKQDASPYLQRGFADFDDVMRWDWANSPLLAFWSQPHNHYLFITKALKTPGLIMGIYLFFAAGFVFCFSRLWRAARS